MLGELFHQHQRPMCLCCWSPPSWGLEMWRKLVQRQGKHLPQVPVTGPSEHIEQDGVQMNQHSAIMGCRPEVT